MESGGSWLCPEENPGSLLLVLQVCTCYIPRTMRRAFPCPRREAHVGNLYSAKFIWQLKAQYMPPGLDSSPVLELKCISGILLLKGPFEGVGNWQEVCATSFKVSSNSRPNLHRCLDLCTVQRGTEGEGITRERLGCLAIFQTLCLDF